MPITSKMRADYAELATQYLDNIPVETAEDFVAIQEALLAITEPTAEHQVRPSLQGRVTAIQEILEEPEMYVQNVEEHQEFKEIILRRVAGKIQELNALTPAEKERYINDQKLLKASEQADKALMAKASRPEEGAFNHSLTHEEWLLEQQERFNQESRLSAAAPAFLRTESNLEIPIYPRLRDFIHGNRPGALMMDFPPERTNNGLINPLQGFTGTPWNQENTTESTFLRDLYDRAAARVANRAANSEINETATSILDYFPRQIRVDDTAEQTVEAEVSHEVESGVSARAVEQLDESDRMLDPGFIEPNP